MADESSRKTPQLTETQRQDVLQRVMEHYTVHYDVILKKLDHAQTATNISMEAANDWDMKVIGQYDSAWKEIIQMFQTCGITQEELFEIEKILDTLPESIREHFERLIKLDKILQTMMITLQKLNFKDAMKTISEVQAGPNPLSGLTSDEYEEDANKGKQPAVKAFKISKYK